MNTANSFTVEDQQSSKAEQAVRGGAKADTRRLQSFQPEHNQFKESQYDTKPPTLWVISDQRFRMSSSDPTKRHVCKALEGAAKHSGLLSNVST